MNLKEAIWEWIDHPDEQNEASEPIESENARVYARLIEFVTRVNEHVNERVTRLSERVTDRVIEGVTRQFIAKEINAIDRMGWSYVFESERDYNAFLDLLTNYFDNNAYTIPEKITRLIKGARQDI